MNWKFLACFSLAVTLTVAGTGIAHCLPSFDPLSEQNCKRITAGMTLEEVKGLLGTPNERTGSLLFGVGVNSDAGMPPAYVWTGQKGTINVNLDNDRRVNVAWYVPKAKSGILAQIRGWMTPSSNFINFQF